MIGYAQQRFVTLDSTKIWINTKGLESRKAEQPVVIFESGLGTPMDNWDRVIDSVASIAPLLTYDRPGIGKSESIVEMPTIKNVADRLVRLLNLLAIKPPYVLVGHSLGGLYVRGFAIHYPELLAGLVIIDPADFTEDHTNRRDYYDVLNWEEAKVDSLIQSFIDQREKGRQKAPASVRRERDFLADIRAKEFQEIIESALPNIPVHMITGGRFDMPKKYRSQEYDDELLFRSKMKHRLWRWTEVIQSVDKGMLLYSGDAGHFVHWDDPDLIISSIDIVLKDYATMKKEKRH